MKSVRSKRIPWLVSGLMVAAGTLPSLAHAGGPGGRCFPHGWRLRTSTGQVAGTSGVLTSQPLATMGVTTWWVQADACAGTDGGRLPVSLVPAVVVPSATTVGIPTYAYVLVGSPPAAPNLGLGGTAAPSPRSPAGASGSPQATSASGTDILMEYNAFVAAEDSTEPAGVGGAPRDLARSATDFAPLAAAVGGPNRLASIDRFLRTKSADPDLRRKALDLFARLEGITPPRDEQLIDAFVDRLSPGAAAGPAPIPARDNRPAGLPAPPSGELRVRVTFENEPPGAPEPAASRDALDSIEAVAKGLGGTILSRDASGIKIRKSDGGIVKFGPDGRVKPY
jgi:hypothetical protein